MSWVSKHGVNGVVMQEPTLALVQPVLPPEVVDAQAGVPLPQGLSLTLTAPGMSPLKVCLLLDNASQCVTHFFSARHILLFKCCTCQDIIAA